MSYMTELDSMKKITKTTKISDYQVKTPQGWVDINALHQTIPYQVYKLELSNGYVLKCADNHIIINEFGDEVFVKNLVVGDRVKTDGGLAIVIKLNNLEYQEVMYDLELDEESNRVYYTNGILSHNTHLAKTLAKEVFGDEEAVIRIDMSEYMDKHNSSRLVGSPPGYVGYEKGGQLTESVKNRPYSVVLFDEIEKAHKDIFNMLLQVLDDGHMTDGLGRKINFKNTIIIMTSNVGAKRVQEFGTGVGFSTIAQKENDLEKAKTIVQKALKNQFSPEFINRIDDIIMFNQLEKEHINRIVGLELYKLDKRLKERGYSIKFTNSVVEYISEKGYDPKFGARPIRRAIQEYIEDYISDEILRKNILENTEYSIKFRKDTDTPILTKVKNE